jgi:hypothetical protein
MTKEEALQMCLEYIETNAHERRCVRWAIKQALAQPPLPEQEPLAGKGKELSEQLKHCARNVAFVAAGHVDMSLAAMQEMFALIDHVCVGIDSPPLPVQPDERNFCPRCGKRTADPTTIHTCTPPQENA